MAIVLANNQEATVTGGAYAFKVDGALDLQWNINGEGFTTIDDGGFTASGTGVVDLPACDIKSINATTFSITLSKVIMK